MPVLTGPNELLRWIAVAGSAALLLACAIDLARADDASPREVYLASLGDHPTLVSAPSGDLVGAARRHIGKRAGDLGLPRSLWCADFVNAVRREAGLRTVPSRRAIDQAKGGRRLSAPAVGAIAIVTRPGGHHTGIIAGFDQHHLVLVSGNSFGRRVAEEHVSRKRLVAVIDPS